MRRAGYLIVYTPLAKLCWDPSPPEEVDASAEVIMRQRWSDVLERDPYYNPNLSRESRRFLVRGISPTSFSNRERFTPRIRRFRRVFLDERTMFFEQMRDEFALEKIGRIAHRLYHDGDRDKGRSAENSH